MCSKAMFIMGYSSHGDLELGLKMLTCVSQSDLVVGLAPKIEAEKRTCEIKKCRQNSLGEIEKEATKTWNQKNLIQYHMLECFKAILRTGKVGSYLPDRPLPLPCNVHASATLRTLR